MSFGINVGVSSVHPLSMVDLAQRLLDRGLGVHTVALPWSTRSMLYEKIHSENKAVSYVDIAEALTLKDRKVKELTAEVTCATLPLSSGKLAIVDQNGEVFLLPKQKKIGEGGSKEVFKAYKINDFGKCQVWADLSITKNGGRGKVDGAKREDKLAANVDSPLVIKSDYQVEFKTKQNGEGLSLLQPLAVGDLDQFIEAHPELTQEEKAKLILEAARGIKALHDKGIMHRDIKEANILVYKVDKGYQVKVADLGCAVQGENLTLQELPKGAGGGTPGYAPKEAFTQNESGFSSSDFIWNKSTDFKWNKSADIYSLGVVLNELLQPKEKLGKIVESYSLGGKLGGTTSLDEILQSEDPLSFSVWSLVQGMMGAEAKRPKIDKVIERLELILA